MPRSFRPWLIAASLGLPALSALWFLHKAGPSFASAPALGGATPSPGIARPDTPGFSPPAFMSAAGPSAGAPLAETAALLAWSERYLAASAAERPALLDEGLALVRARRPRLAELIRTDPEAALLSAVPRAVRAQLPSAIVAELEKFVSARAELAVIQTCFPPPGTARDSGTDLHRATVIDGREYRVHVHGSRLRDGSLPSTSLIGIALDGDIAVADSRLRILEAGEPLPGAATSLAPDEIAVEADGAVTVLPSRDELPAFAASLLASEQNPVVNEADAGAGSSTVTGRPTQAWTHGAKKLLVIRVDFSDRPGTPVNTSGNLQINPAYLDTIINGAGGVRAFLQAASFGKTDILFDPATDVTGVLRLPQTASYYAVGDGTDAYSTLLHSDARAAALAVGFNASAYDRVAVVFSKLSSLPNSKLTYGGLGSVIGPNLWVNGAFDLRVVGHELGHNYGLRHANLWRPAGADPVSLAGDNPATTTDERSIDYGDPFDLMGEGGFFANDFSHWNKSLLQWIPDAAVTVATSGGTYRVHRFDSSSADLSAPRALKIVRDSTRDYWIGYRRGTTSAAADNGAYVLWGYNSTGSGHLLDLVTPGSDAADAPLPLNTTFNDSAAGIALRPIAQGGSGADEWLDVRVTLQPRIQWAATGYVVNEQGGSAVLTATRTANANGNVTVSYSTVPGTATAGLDYTHTAGTLTWLDGDTAPKTVTVPLVADALVEGTETFTVTLSSPAGGVVVDPASATVILADPGARDTAFAANFINNTVYRALVQPDGDILIAGSFTQLRNQALALVGAGRISRLDTSGVVDPDFGAGTGANGTIQALARLPDGKILIAGAFTSYNGAAINRIARLNKDGSLDSGFNPGTGANATVYALLPLPDGDILVGGSFTTINGVAREYIARLNSDGSLDSAFTGPDFAGTSGWFVRCLALQTDGKILIGGAFYQSTGNLSGGLRRLTASGATDASFTGLTQGASESFDPAYLGTIYTIALLPDGRILIGGDFAKFNGVARAGLARLSTTGALDAGFTASVGTGFIRPGESSASTPYVTTLRILPDSRILIGGNFNTVNGAALSGLACLQAGGALDTAFAAAGGHGYIVEDLVLQPDGNVVLTGYPAQFHGSSDSRSIWRFVPGLSGTPGTIQFSADAFAATEGLSTTLGITRTGGSLGALSAGYSTVADSALAGADFTTTTGVLTWADGDAATKTITIPATLDASPDTPETFVVNLGAPLIGGALLGDRQQATVTINSAFFFWQTANFTDAERSNSSIGGDTADPDGDGLNNLAEFALGRAPKVADAGAAWTTAMQNVSGANYLTITFRRRAPALDLAYAVQTSGDLGAAWTPNAVQIGSAVANGDGTETVTYRDVIASPAGARRFLRVVVTRTP